MTRGPERVAEYELVTMVATHLGAVGGDRAAHRLAVDRDREQLPIGPVGGVSLGCGRGGGAHAAAVPCDARSASQEPIAASIAARGQAPCNVGIGHDTIDS